MSFTLTGGGDHEGADWTPDGDTIAGVHYGIGTFTVSNGATATINTGSELEVYADTVSVVGTIQGDGKGYAGGGTGADGSGAGGGHEGAEEDCTYGGGGGAGYGGGGGNAGGGPTSGLGGIEYGTSDDIEISMGSGGGGPHILSGTGGRGGGSVVLFSNTLTVTGTITCNGANASGVGAGGGAGGGILLVGGTLTTTGTLTTNGGNGTASGGAGGGGGGGGSGGRIKIFYFTINATGLTTSYTFGTGASGLCESGNNGNVGSYNNTSKISQCTSSIPLGQTFTIGADSASLIDKITLWVTAVNTSGDFILKVWDSTSKSTEYGTKTVTVSGTGSTDFEFADWIRIPDGESIYYMELTTAGAGDIEIGVYGISTVTGGDYYRNLKVVPRFDLYHQVYSVDHVKGISIYNTVDTTIKSNVANLMLIGIIHRINSNNTGTIQYTDDFTTNKYLADYTALSGVTHDSGDDELDIADSGYIYYTVDTKYTITGMPTLTSTVDITAGTPTIQISSDAVTWYDIDTAIVDDVSTEYDLDNAANLSLKGLTTFYLRFDCGGAGTNTCSIKTFTLDVNIVTVDVPNPVINIGAANTFKCEQDTDSGLNATVELIYRDRKWT